MFKLLSNIRVQAGIPDIAMVQKNSDTLFMSSVPPSKKTSVNIDKIDLETLENLPVVHDDVPVYQIGIDYANAYGFLLDIDERLRNYIIETEAVIGGSFVTHLVMTMFGMTPTFTPGDIDVFIEASKSNVKFPCDTEIPLTYHQYTGHINNVVGPVRQGEMGNHKVQFIFLNVDRKDELCLATSDDIVATFDDIVASTMDFTIVKSTITIDANNVAVLKARHTDDICNHRLVEIAGNKIRESRIRKWNLRKFYKPVVAPAIRKGRKVDSDDDSDGDDEPWMKLNTVDDHARVAYHLVTDRSNMKLMIDEYGTRISLHNCSNITIEVEPHEVFKPVEEEFEGYPRMNTCCTKWPKIYLKSCTGITIVGKCACVCTTDSNYVATCKVAHFYNTVPDVSDVSGVPGVFDSSDFIRVSEWKIKGRELLQRENWSISSVNYLLRSFRLSVKLPNETHPVPTKTSIIVQMKDVLDTFMKNVIAVAPESTVPIMHNQDELLNTIKLLIDRMLDYHHIPTAMIEFLQTLNNMRKNS